MKAVVFYRPQQYEVEDIPKPEISAHEILLKVTACGLCGSDLRTLKFGHRKINPPYTIGHEVCGEVAEVGSRVSEYTVGDRLSIAPVVYCGKCSYCRQQRFEFCENYHEIGQTWPGGMAEYMVLPQEVLAHGIVHPIPPSLSPQQAALSEPLSACLHAIDRIDFQYVQTAVIFGAGTIGCLLLQLLKTQGVSKVFVIDPNITRLEVACSIDPDVITKTASPDTIQEIKEFTRHSNIDLIFTATAAPIVQQQAIELAGKGCQIVVFAGLPKGQSEVLADYNKIHYECLKLIGSSIYRPQHHARALNMIENGSIKVDALITTFPLVEFKRGVEMALDGKIIKAVFIP